jgi:hypothetical protein
LKSDSNIKSNFYISLNTKELLENLDLKKEIVLTMLNQLQKLSEKNIFFKLDSILNIGIQMRFYSKTLD